MTDLTGYPELTPYKGGWCGNDLFPEALSEVDVFIDLDTDEVYLGELNPRVSGASSMTNVTAGAYCSCSTCSSTWTSTT
jgi:hypothetical protein